MFPTGKPLIKSYYTGKKTDRTTAVSESSYPNNNNNEAKQPTTIIKFTQKDYYGNEHQTSEATWPIIQKQPLKPSVYHWWSRTFTLATVPFCIFGCPSHHLIQSGTFPTGDPIDTTTWLGGIFSVKRLPYNLVSFLFLIPTVVMNAYTIYQLYLAFDTLFITAKYEATLFLNISRTFQYLLLVIPLDYVWLKGYTILDMIQGWNKLCVNYRGIGCLSFNFRLQVALQMVLIIGVFGIRYVTRLQFLLDVPSLSVKEKVEKIAETVVELGHFLMLPLYVTFCYGVRFHLLVIKALIYQWIRDRVTPGVRHLNTVKILYTQASDSILRINGWFYMYMSIVIPAILWETVAGSSVVFARVILPSSLSSMVSLFTGLKEKDAGGPPKFGEMEETEEGLVTNLQNSSQLRKFNLEMLGIALVPALICWTIWQAVKTNDFAREIHVWLNDFATGGSGVDIRDTLKKLGVNNETTKDDDKVLIVSPDKGELGAGNVGVVWARTRMLNDGSDDEFLEKFKLLKAYIHVRMELEDSALLNIACVGYLKPDLGGRLARYRVLF